MSSHASPGSTGRAGSQGIEDGGIGDGRAGMGGDDSGARGGDDGRGGSAVGSGGSNGDAGPSSCTAAAAPPQRLIRLAFSQLARSVTSVLGDDALDAFSLPGSRRYFPPLAGEGEVINSPTLDTTIAMVESAIARKLSPAGFFSANGCADDDCVQAYLLALADSAFRRPLADDEKSSIVQAYMEMRTAGLALSEAGPYAVEGILISPAVVYRTEFGSTAPPGTDTTLTPHERASQIAYFLSDGPPDGPLRQAAEGGMLADVNGLRAEVDRYLQMPAVHDNLAGAMMAYYDVEDARVAVKDPAVYPDWTPSLIDSIEAEARQFMGRVLWEGTVFDQLTSHRSAVDENLAHLYDVPYPATPGSGFVALDLPAAQRSGVLTLASWIAAKTSATITSPLQRGTWVNTHIACGPVPPDHPDPESFRQPDGSGLATANYRLTSPVCASCHQFMDTYGALLENYDGIGRFRSSYDTGEGIAPRVTLPAFAGGAVVSDMSELAEQLTSHGVFSPCLAASLIQYAGSTDERPDPHTCAVQDAHAKFWAGDRSFTSLVREVTVSGGLSHRTVGAP